MQKPHILPPYCSFLFQNWTMRGRRATSKPAAAPTLGVNDDYHDISMH